MKDYEPTYEGQYDKCCDERAALEIELSARDARIAELERHLAACKAELENIIKAKPREWGPYYDPDAYEAWVKRRASNTLRKIATDAVVLREPDQVIAIKPDDPLYDVLVNRLVGSSVDVAPPTAPEPSRLEIAARFAVAIMRGPDPQLATAKAELIAGWAIEQTDALIAAARKESK